MVCAGSLARQSQIQQTSSVRFPSPPFSVPPLTPHTHTQLKVRMQAPSAHGTLRQHAYQIYSANGLKGMYKAVGPTTFRAGILTSCQLGCYDHAKHVCVPCPSPPRD